MESGSGVAESTPSGAFVTQDNSTDIVIGIRPVAYVVFVESLAVLGIIGNLMNLLVMTSSSLRGHSFAVYMIFMAVSDSIVLIVDIAMPGIIDLHALLTLNVSLCQFWYFVMVVAWFTSPWLLCAMTLDRYVNIVRFHMRVRFCTVKIGLFICSLLCITGIILASPPIFNLNIIENGKECELLSKSLKYYFVVYTIVIVAALPVGVTFVLSVRICVAIYHWYKADPSVDDREARRLSFSIVLVSVISTLTLMPNSIISVADYIIRLHYPNTYDEIVDRGSMRIAWRVSNVIRIINFGMNFYILVGFSAYYRAILYSRLPSCLCYWRQDHTDERRGLTRVTGGPSMDQTDPDDEQVNRPAGSTGDVVVASIRGLESPEYLLIGGNTDGSQMMDLS